MPHGTSQHGGVVQLYLAAVSVTVGAGGVRSGVVITALSVIPSPLPVVPVKFPVTGPEAEEKVVPPGLQAPPLQVPEKLPVIWGWVEDG